LQKDPVCGMMVDEKKAKFTTNLEGKTIYFCPPHAKHHSTRILRSTFTYRALKRPWNHL